MDKLSNIEEIHEKIRFIVMQEFPKEIMDKYKNNLHFKLK